MDREGSLTCAEPCFPCFFFCLAYFGTAGLFPIHTVSPKMDAAPLTASRAGEEPASTSEASTSGLLRAAARAAEALKAEGLWGPWEIWSTRSGG